MHSILNQTWQQNEQAGADLFVTFVKFGPTNSFLVGGKFPHKNLQVG